MARNKTKKIVSEKKRLKKLEKRTADFESFGCADDRVEHGEPNALGTCPYCDAILIDTDEE